MAGDTPTREGGENIQGTNGNKGTNSGKAPQAASSDERRFPLLPLKNVVVFPRTIVNLTIGRARSAQALNSAVDGDRLIVVAAQRPNSEARGVKGEGRAEDDLQARGQSATGPDEESHTDLYSIGTLVEVRQVRRQGDTLTVEVEALRRVRLGSIEPAEGGSYLVEAEPLVDRARIGGRETETLMSELATLFDAFAQLNPKVPPEAPDHIRAARQPGYMADLLAAHLLTDTGERQQVLEILDVPARLDHMAGVLANIVEILQTEQRVKDKVRQQIDKNQREFYLREQLKAIHDELAGEGGNEIEELRGKLLARGLPDETLTRLLKELTRLERMPAISPESTVLRNYIDWVLALPWNERTDDRIDLPLAEQILEEDHYGLLPVKERILDYLAVRQLLTKGRSLDDSQTASHAQHSPSILCFVGPPGVGKTSLGQSIARAMNRKFVRLSLGGVHDEAEIRGHRRTYVGAMPGRIIQAMRNAGTVNPVILLDELDKMTSDMRGDPGAAMLEVLDPAQNHTFTDHYLDVPFDLSSVLFIATANTLFNIPRPLRDRMEIVEIGGYTEEEKVQIARRHLLPRQIDAHGLEHGFLEVPDRTLRNIIRTYTREAGVRELERKLAAVCRKAARKVVGGRSTRVRLSSHNLEEHLGPPRYRVDAENRQDQVGVALGLAWTEHGGELLPVEVALMPGRGGLTITGRLGDIMQESARAALSFARSRAERLQINLESMEKCDLHIHLPEGAIPKDGPSAGITIGTALISALTQRPVRSDTGLTGEITLTGRVLAIGGLKEKALAAHRGGVKRIIAPKANRPDWHELPTTVRRDVEFIWVEAMDEVIAEVLREPLAGTPAVLVTRHEEGETQEPHHDTVPYDPAAHPTVQTAQNGDSHEM
jgi:ATP-dependent Lon protease